MLSENLLYGQIPTELSTMPRLKVFSAFRSAKSGPRLSGSLPAFNKLPQLTDIYLQGNELQGSIPSNFVSASQSVKSIRLSSNLLTGAVPAELGSIKGLTLELDDNEIGSFPASFCEKNDWMDGAIKDYKCDGFLCPPGTASPIGRSTNSSTICQNCTAQSVAPFYGSTSCDGPPTDREILMNLFYSLNGDRWYRNDFWGSTADICDWYGIGCIEGQLVIINLRGNNLKGLPSPDIFYLRELKVLWLYSNPITFSFENIGSARKLEDLNLDSTNLHTLHGIGAASSLISFSARFTALRGQFPDDLLRLTNLRTLHLGDNGLTGTLPKSLADMRHLVALNLHSNQLTGQLPAFDDLHFLNYIDMSNNGLSGPISRKFLDKLPSTDIPTIKLSQNQLTGVIPEEFDRFNGMALYLQDNYILGLPLTLCDNPDWNNGDVGDFGCDAILCKPGTYNAIGRRRRNGASCKACASARYFGESVCGDFPSATRAALGFASFALGCVLASLLVLS